MGRRRSAEPGTAIDISERLKEINQQFSKVKLREKDGKLTIRAIFPPKSGETESHRSELATGCNATPAGLKIAEQKAREVDAQLLLGKFDWTPYLKGRLKRYKPAETVQEWVERYEADHWQHTERNPTKENSYHKTYRLQFKRLPQDSPLTLDLLRQTILDLTKPGSRSRKGFAMAYRKLAEFAGMPEKELKQLSQMGKGYSPKSVEPRDLPSDEDVLDVWQALENPAWKWVLSVLAIYGLRPHEVFKLRTDRLNEDPPVLEVESATKTGWRVIYPCKADIWQEMTPEMVMYPNIQTVGKNNNQLGDKISQEFRERQIPFNPYDLRHAYARRLYVRGFGSYFIAKSMGHSEEVQRTIYRAWWGQETFDREYQQVIQRWEHEQ